MNTAETTHITQITEERRQWLTLSRPLIAEKSKGLAGKPVPGPGVALEDASSLEFLFSTEPALSSKKSQKMGN